MNTRLIAARVLSRVLQDGQSLTAALEMRFTGRRIRQRQGFHSSALLWCLQNYHRLDFILSELLDKPLKDQDVKALALVGLYQLKYMRVKPHAAVSETVLADPQKTMG